MCVENLKKNLRYLRRKHGFSQPFIAAKCNKKSYTTIQKWESGDAEPSLKDVVLLSEMYGINIDDFVKADLENQEGLLNFKQSQSKYSHSSSEQSLITDYRKLNSIGQEKGSEYVHDLTENPKYTVPGEPVRKKEAWSG